MSESNECCGECDASRKSYPVGTCAYAGDCPCHSTTPDTEVEKLVDAIDDIMAKYHMGEHMYSPEREEIVALLTSRDTYWKERVEAVRRDLKARMAHEDYTECVTCDETLYHLDTLLDNLK